MSRIRGIDAKVQNEVLQTRRSGCNETNKKDEDQSICPKDDAERQQIKELLSKLPKLERIFSVHRKIGEGTFSSVYLGSLRAHAALPAARRRWFALKHLVPTAHPARIEHELRCLRDIGGKNNVIGVDLCLRHLDTIVFVMPYIPHRKFSEYVGDMDAAEVRDYMRALLTALRHVHAHGVIHRDVKPSNFLYDRDNRRYLLVDFGLAQRVVAAPPAAPTAPATAHAPPPAHNNNTLKRSLEEEGGDGGPEAKRLALDLSVRGAGHVSVPLPPPPAPTPAPAPAPAPATNKPATKVGASAGVGGAGGGVGGAGGVSVSCACAGAGGVCGACSARPPPRAPRAGTQGFRPPEVLLKVVCQTTGVDVWAAGVVLASALCARYPFFRAADDCSALAELVDLLGTKPLQRAATALGRRLVTSVPRRGLCLRKLCAWLRGGGGGGVGGAAGGGGAGGAGGCGRCHLPPPDCLCRDETKPAWEFSPDAQVAGFPDSAFGLLARLLEPDPRRRPSAHQALQHPFLADPPTPQPQPHPHPA